MPTTNIAQDGMAPGVLIAMPQLRDPNFQRSVVLLLEHGDDGAFGVVINHPIDQTVTVRAGEEDELTLTDHVFSGGPVEPQIGLVLHGVGWRAEHTQQVVNGLLVSEPSVSVPRLVGQHRVPYRLILGYAGWGPKQLESELTQGAWLCGPASAELVLGTGPDAQWNEALGAMGINPLMLVPTTDSH